MSAFKLHYQQQPADELNPDRAKAKSHINGQVAKLVLPIIIAAICMLSFAANIISYTHWRNLQQTQDTHLLQYDSLLSAKLLTDQELARLKAKLNTHPVEEELIRVLTHKIATLPEKNRVRDKN